MNLKTGAEAVNVLGVAQDIQNTVAGVNKLINDMGTLNSDVKSALSGNSNAWEKFDGAEGGYWDGMFDAASSAGSAGVKIVTKP